MSSGMQLRTRSDLLAALTLPPGQAVRIVELLRRRDILARLGLCLLVALTIWVTTGAWNPPFA